MPMSICFVSVETILLRVLSGPRIGLMFLTIGPRNPSNTLLTSTVTFSSWITALSPKLNVLPPAEEIVTSANVWS